MADLSKDTYKKAQRLIFFELGLKNLRMKVGIGVYFNDLFLAIILYSGSNCLIWMIKNKSQFIFNAYI